MEGQARSTLLVARSARNQQVSPSKILFILLQTVSWSAVGLNHFVIS